ncbi:MAG: acetyl-CoA C-acyltransferase [Bacteroidetes bacterium]|nr:acetyl-CoA C-acyltransferase [Bacteroidota bacterium]
MRQVVIIDAVRTPIGRLGGVLSSVRPDDLLALVLSELVKRTEIDPAIIDDVFAGCANQAGEDNRNVARMGVLLAGYPDSVSGVTVNRLCASGLEAVNQAAKAILVGEGDVFIGSGVESMSRAPWIFPKSEQAFAVGHPEMFDSTLGWRMINSKLEAMKVTVQLGETAEIIAERMGITRAEQDAFALESHRRAVTAIAEGRFEDEIVSVQISEKKTGNRLIEKDEHPRYRHANGKVILDTDLERLSTLRPAFRQNGTVTAGNSSGLNDGAAAVLLMTAEKAKQLGLRPMARWIGSSTAGVDPKIMGFGPVPATKRLMARLGLDIHQFGLVEVNEAFAAQAIGVMRELELDSETTNVNGGAVALGHPLGCSGARILTTLLHEMNRRSPTETVPYYGLVTLCVGVGQGVSTAVEWIGN